MRALQTQPGTPDPLGATWRGRGTNFALYSEGATAVDLCLFDPEGKEARVRLRHRTEFVWHVHVNGVGPGQTYGYRVHGPWEPERGMRFNPANVLLDPYARALGSAVDFGKGASSYDILHPDKDLVRTETDQKGAPLGVVIDPSFDWGDDAPPNTPQRRSVIYEAHVKGLTMRHPDVPEELRGTYMGMASEPILRYLRELGVTAIELLPVHGFVDDQFLIDRNLRNYWGYNSIAFFAPEIRYRAGTVVASEVEQMKRMVKALHASGIEVILDVVYNHTAEGNHLGPTFSFRGIDNATYYRLVPDSPRFYFDYTGTGNTFNVRHPQTMRLLMDSLRYWIEEMHVDGFRFDLAATLARGLYEVDRLSSFFTAIHQDPVIGKVKLIAEPWDVGQGGYQVGRFPVRWAEWNGRYRDTMRAFWRGDGGRAADLAYRLTGSSDLYQDGGRSPSSSINFITAHDGFTLHDLVSYDGKHNEANGEGSRDGEDHNLSWNCGAEGETDDAGVNAIRHRQVRNLLATLLLSQGTPMISAGDELGRTQRGNNNAYCQDNETSWHDWDLDDERRALLSFTRNLIRLRRDHPLTQRATFFGGREIHGVGVRDVVWFRHDGAPMTDDDWSNPSTSSLGVFMAGSGLDAVDEEGRPQIDDDLVLLLNASGADLEFTLPAFVERGKALAWNLLVDTAFDASNEVVEPGRVTATKSRSLKLFSRRAVGPGGLQAAYGAPVSTYRLQLRNGFGFAEARALLDYLDELGVAGVYTSPLLRAQHGSTHGYDVVDHCALDPAIGTSDDFRSFTDALQARGMKHLVDFVPNHLGIGSGENAWWNDVLENGPASQYADHFDIEWRPPAGALEDKVLLPVLGRQFGQEVDDLKVSIRREGGALWVVYGEQRFPASPRSYALALEAALGHADGAEAPHVQELESILGSLRHLPPAPSAADPAGRSERAREKEVVKRRLSALVEASRACASAIDGALEGISKSPDRLERFLNAQNYRLSYWRVATEEINYRRFFDVNELAAIRMEDPEVFASTHSLLLDMLRQGSVSGVRLDHTDGLYDPEQYFHTLQSSARQALRDGDRPADAPIYVVAEKILEPGEELRTSWAVSGTSGYDFLAAVGGVFVDPAAGDALSRLYEDFAQSASDFPAVVYQAKRDVMDGSFSSEIHVLAHVLKRVADGNRSARDFTLPSLVRVIKETMAALPVYRTYVRPKGLRQQSDEDRIRAAINLAERKNPLMDPSVFEFLADVLLMRERSPDAVGFAMRFQQLSGPIKAKGVEDTAAYRFNRLVSLNEVGGDAERFGGSVEDLHAHNAAISARWPLSMTTTTTHDVKRSEDVRARLAVLTEIPELWRDCAYRLRELSREASPEAWQGISRNDEYAFYQTLVGTLPPGTREVEPDLVDRLTAYMRKAVREAKLETSWEQPRLVYESAIDQLVRDSLHSPPFVTAAAGLVDTIATYGATNSLSQLAVRLASPGVPDVYQGCETWCFSLVDPDNRRPVAYEPRRSLLADLKKRGEPTPALCREILDAYTDGRAKLHVTSIGLRLRREHPDLFLEGRYEPLGDSPHLVGFERSLGARSLLCVAPRLSRRLTKGERPWPLGDVWGEARLATPERTADKRFRNVFTGEELDGNALALRDVFACFPVAWLLQL